MKHGILFFFTFFSAQCMDKNQEPLSVEQEIIGLIDLLEEHTSCAHPHAPARILIAGDQLVTLPAHLVWAHWQKSQAISNARLILANTNGLVKKHENSPLGSPARLLQNHALKVLAAIEELDAHIQKMPSCDYQTPMVASSKNES